MPRIGDHRLLFFSRVVDGPLFEGWPCWVWQGRLDKGYGRFEHGGRWLAHRWAWTYLIGPIPDDLFLDHRCQNRACVNPRHLEPVTPEENMRRAAEAGAYQYPRSKRGAYGPRSS